MPFDCPSPIKPDANLLPPEVLAPAGDVAALHAAIEAGADAVYFGLESFNARARAANFRTTELASTMRELHDRGMRGYVALNTLVFDDELGAVEESVRACAQAAVDAVIVQDLGVARLVRAIAPELPIHASTQMTCVDSLAIKEAQRLGAKRVILPRELSLKEIALIAAETNVELEVFAHGALCIGYSGQCLTSAAIGGRSANRGVCAQACRLPYELIVDGVRRDPGDKAFLLSPADLETVDLVPQLMALGVRALKIEGRLKGPEYVAATTRLYKKAVAAAMGTSEGPTDEDRKRASLAFTRGSGPGFLRGVDHQRLVEGRTSDHRGLRVGTCLGTALVRTQSCLRIALDARLVRGDGILVEGGFANEGELGGRIWALYVRGNEVDSAESGSEALVWLGPDKALGKPEPERRVFQTAAAAPPRAIHAESASERPTTGLDVRVVGALGAHPELTATTADGRRATVQLDAKLEVARSAALGAEAIREKLGRLGDTPFTLRSLEIDIPSGSTLPISSLNRGRRSLVAELLEKAHRPHRTVDAGLETLLARAMAVDGLPPPCAGLFVLCRDLNQARAALDAGATGIYLDFLDLTGLGAAVEELRRQCSTPLGLAFPRIRKPNEERIARYLNSLEPDFVLVRSLGGWSTQDTPSSRPPRIGDFSLNVTNRISAATLLEQGLHAFAPAFDLDAAQLMTLLQGPLARFAEVVVHHAMPLFHMQHCLFSAHLSSGHDATDCGRPCERSRIALRDRTGRELPVMADVGCRNTVFHAAAQSAAELAVALQARGVLRFRVELLREDAATSRAVVSAYRELLEGRSSPAQVLDALAALPQYEVLRGSLRVFHPTDATAVPPPRRSGN